MINPDFLFSKPQDERVDFDDKELIQLRPYGLSLANDATRPFLILKDESGDYVLPVAINQLEAGATLTQTAHAMLPLSVHTFSEKLLTSLDIKLERCVFVEIKGVHQFVRVYMNHHPRYQSMKFRADEVMSLCIHLKTPLFATKSYINKSKLMSAEIIGIAKGLNENPSALLRGHTYLM
ncbi:MAG: hypothetical protein A2622_12330 [Bdellovibrionales bacterium RIFCSPHIGHO2_01_FULL_40_29]|nr:MAG: hypothetical protein A2622_12330 [Bdellovibrionales bacterium RIFCSPHIGHO2_01_FULL_40_29]OFZ32973.1 MAG: hypothetical protein A3D17_09640 [Bdellovibrionales bacterium RIFCSPHIGHO2_02_FULL_40_15]